MNGFLGNCTHSTGPFIPTKSLKFKVMLEERWFAGSDDMTLQICKLTAMFGNNFDNRNWGWSQTWEWNGGESGKIFSTNDKESENWIEMQRI